jgi:hypothetical protein
MCLLLLPTVGMLGCASLRGGSDRPTVELSISLDKSSYRTGEPLIAEVRLSNPTGRQLVLPSFDANALRFMQGEKGLHARVVRDPVHSKTAVSRPRTVVSGGWTARRFVFTRVTLEPGHFALLVSMKRTAVEGEPLPNALYAASDPFEVTKEVALRRDPANGLILKDQAIEIAKAEVPGNATRARAVLMPMGDSGLFTWVIAVRIEEGESARTHTVQVDPYVGRIRPLKLKPSEDKVEPKTK